MSLAPQGTSPLSSPQLVRLEELIDDTLADALATIAAVASVERPDAARPFWYVRLDGDDKTNFSAELTLGQRSLLCESYFMPAPEENAEALYRHLLVRNRSMRTLGFVVGPDEGIYLRGQIDNRLVTSEVVDHLLATTYDYTERFFVTAMKIGFASRFRG